MWTLNLTRFVIEFIARRNNTFDKRSFLRLSFASIIGRCPDHLIRRRIITQSKKEKKQNE